MSLSIAVVVLVCLSSVYGCMSPSKVVIRAGLRCYQLRITEVLEFKVACLCVCVSNHTVREGREGWSACGVNHQQSALGRRAPTISSGFPSVAKL